MSTVRSIETHTIRTHVRKILFALLILTAFITLITLQTRDLAALTGTSATYLVNSTTDRADANPGDGFCADAMSQCTLRAALEEAELAEGFTVTITFDLSTPATILLTDSLPIIAAPSITLAIEGPGSDLLTIDGNAAYRPFFIDSGATSTIIAGMTITNSRTISDGAAIYNLSTLHLDDLVIQGGHADGDGGGIYTKGELFVDESSILDNTAGDDGGGIFNAADKDVFLDTVVVEGNSASNGGGLYTVEGFVELVESTVNDNHAVDLSGSGGGIYIIGGEGSTGSVVLHNSTVSNNSATGDGGGIFNLGALTKVINSTISGNHAGDDGGGIAGQRQFGVFAASVKLASSTIANNSADSRGGGILNDDSLFESKNSILAKNTNQSGSSPNCMQSGSPTFTTEYILIGNDNGCAGQFTGSVGNLVGTAASPIDPNLGRLFDNGGETKTHSLLTIGSLSPARDTGDPAGCTDLADVMLVTDQRGASRVLDGDVDGIARCDMGAFEAGLGNDTWPRALRLNLSGSTTEPTATFAQAVDKAGQSRWYKFSVDPGSRVEVKLENLPANYDITLYKDIQAVFDSLLNPSSNEDLVQLTAEFAPEAFAPDAFAADAFAPEAFAPEAFAPEAFAPEAFAPEAFAPEAFAPEAFAPEAFAPEAFAPEAFAPEAFAPEAFAPEAFAPEAFAADLAYTSAQIRSLIGVSAFDGLADEVISVNTWDNSGDFYVRVTGRNGAFAPSGNFDLAVKQTNSICQGIDATLPASTLTPVAGDYRTLILADWGRMDTADPLLPTLQSDLAIFAGRSEIAGVVIDVSTDGAVATTNTQADAFSACPEAKNLVAEAIKQIIDGYRTLNPNLEYIVLVGNDNVIPFFRYPDRALLANEKNYVPPVSDETTSYASLISGYILSQDAYGATTELSLSNTTLPIPGLPVGRLVETPSDILAMLAAYNVTVTAGTPGQAPTPQSAFVSGYDFLEDAALAIQTELAAGIGGQPNTLITPSDLSPLSDDPRVWTADDLRNQFLGSRHDISFLAGHFSASAALAADYSTRLLASEIAASTVDLQNALIFSAGCHSGYNIVNDHGITNVTREPDWAQAFAQKGATLIAGTGYQYGDTEFLKYGEQLYLNFSRELLVGNGPVPIGKALVAAKQTYLANTPNMRGIHEKTVLIATLFGLPMLSIDMPAGRNTPTDPPSIVDSTTAFAEDPGATLDLLASDIVTVSFKPKQNILTLSSVTNDDTVATTYLSGTDGIVGNPSEPVLPQKVSNVSIPGTVLRGVGFRGGSYTDLLNITPLTGAPTTEIRGVHPPFQSDVYFPIQPWRVNYFDVLSDPASGITRLAITPAQFLSSGPDSTTGTLRQWNNMSFRFYYSANTTTFAAGSTPALSAPPSIAKVMATSGNGTLNFRVTVVGDLAAGIQEVWITYTEYDCVGCSGIWQSFDLTQNSADSTIWEGTLPLNGTPSANIRYIAQAVNGVGLVALDTNKGEYFIPDIDPGDLTMDDDALTDPLTTTLTFQSAPTTGAYGTEASFSAKLLDSNGAPVIGQTIRFALGSQQQRATTNGSGIATIMIPLLSGTGDTTIRATFAGNTTYQAAEATSAFTIEQQATQITLSTVNSVVQEGEETMLVATLTDANGGRLREKGLFFIVSGNGQSYAVSQITNLVGEVDLGIVPLPAGFTYTVDVYFSGAIPLPGDPLLLTDVNYLPASASGTLRIETDNTAATAVDDSYSTARNTPLTKVAPGVLSNDTDADNDTLTAQLVSDVTNGTLTLNADGSFVYTPTLNFSGTDTFTYKANDGTVDSNTATVTITVIDLDDGDCNADQQLNAGDISSIVLEIFDGDGTAASAAPGGTFPGVAMCDANVDGVIDAGDIGCTVLLIFNGKDACEADNGNGTTMVELTIPSQLQVNAGGTVAVPVTLLAGNHQVTAVAFTLTFDPLAFAVDPRDLDNNGIPDAIAFDAITGQTSIVTHDNTSGQIAIALFSNTPDAPLLSAGNAEGVLVTVQLTAQRKQADGTSTIDLAESSIGDTNGRALDVTVNNSDVEIIDQSTENSIYLPLLIR